MSMILSSWSKPSRASQAPGLRTLARFSSRSRVFLITSFTRLLLPLPDTPVTQVNTPRGISTSMPFRLLARAPRTRKNRSLCRRWAGTGMHRRPDRNWPVMESGLAMISSGVPWATTWPPCSPAPGPISTIWSAESMVSSSCSTTMRVLPRSRIPFRVASSRALSRWCRPMLGSSRIYSTPTSPEPIWVAKRIRWASPPDRVPAERDRVR